MKSLNRKEIRKKNVHVAHNRQTPSLVLHVLHIETKIPISSDLLTHLKYTKLSQIWK